MTGDRRLLVLLVLAAGAPLSIFVALTHGSLPTAPGDLMAALNGESGTAAMVIRELRLPRAVSAFAIGGLLALAGALLQVLLRNPLADPYILGVSGGAAAAALLATLLGAGLLLVSGAAFVGAFATIWLVFVLSRLGRAPWTTHRLLLTGVVCAAGFGALVSLLLAVAPPGRVPGMVFWLLGDLANASQPLAALAALAAGLTAALARARALNALARGETVAATLGENTLQLRWLVYLLAALSTAVAVSLAGTIGFVGFVVPHVLRLLGLGDQRLLLPAAALLGGSFLTLADTLARTLTAPAQLPVGAVTALLGVPVFLWLLSRERRA